MVVPWSKSELRITGVAGRTGGPRMTGGPRRTGVARRTGEPRGTGGPRMTGVARRTGIDRTLHQGSLLDDCCW